MKSFISSLTLAFGLVVTLVTSPALAGAGHGPQHGGVAREIKGVSYELVARPDSLTLHVSDHGKPIATRGATAEAVVYAGNARTPVSLMPAGENRMAARGSFRTGVGVRVIVTTTLPGNPPVKATFNLK